MEETNEKSEVKAEKWCKYCKQRVSKKCNLINKYVPKKDGCSLFDRKKV